MAKKKKDDVRCKGTRRSAEHWGEPCGNRPVPGSDYCKFHGGASVGLKNGKGRPKGTPKPKGAGGRPIGNNNARKHGAFSPRLLPEEQPAFEHFLEEYLRDVHNPSVTDRRALERLAVLEAKWHMAVMKDAPGDALETLQRLLHRELRVLQVTRESKENRHGTGNTPAEIMANLLMTVADRKALMDKAEPKPVVHAELEDLDAEYEVVEVVDVADGQSPDS